MGKIYFDLIEENFVKRQQASLRYSRLPQKWNF